MTVTTMELYRRARRVLPFVFTLIRTVEFATRHSSMGLDPKKLYAVFFGGGVHKALRVLVISARFAFIVIL